MSVRMTVVATIGAILASSMIAVPGGAQIRVNTDDEWCAHGGGGDRAYVCEVREATLPASARVTVDARPNGGIRVEGGSRSDMLVRARVSAWADTEAEAREIISAIQLDLERGAIDASGPKMHDGVSWSVSYRLSVPTATDLDLESTNGGITIADVKGAIDFRTTNGGVRLEGLAGAVKGRTMNGGVSVALAGETWDGTGLNVKSTNGGVTILVPDGYAAHLETGTTNGGMHVDFPVMVQGRLGKHLAADLGGGGPPIAVMTTNGGVTVKRPN